MFCAPHFLAFPLHINPRSSFPVKVNGNMSSYADERNCGMEKPSPGEWTGPTSPRKPLSPTALPIHLTVNGVRTRLHVEAWTSLLEALREQTGLTGTKKGCDHGQCGACTVLVNGRRVNSCLTLAVMKDGAEVTTIEGLAQGDELSPLQRAFVEADAFQCGYCTPGQICSAMGLITEGKASTREDIRELMSGNLCRCGAYSNILTAIEKVVQESRS